MVIVIATTLWRRSALETLTLARLRNVASTSLPDVSTKLVAVGSEADDNTQPRRRAEAAGFTYIDHPNVPLGTKHQAILDAIKPWAFDALLIMGSDNWLTDGALKKYADQAAALSTSAWVIGVTDCYFVNTRDGRAAYWPGYARGTPRYGETIGAGRLYSRGALDAVGWRLWDAVARGLDRVAMARLRAARVPSVALSQLQLGVRLIDLKSETNLWRFEHFAGRGTRVVDGDTVLARYPAEELSALTEAFPGVMRKWRSRR